ncbi:MAG TPA: hypothetical protein VFW96_09310 [Thermomicrobiales bacterium]|nr:hypothetical protein [Thermomicrobiales bacterium]
MATTQALMTKQTVAGVFDGPNHAKLVLVALRDAGFTGEQISLVAKERKEGYRATMETNMAGEDAGIGATAGGVIGAAAGGLIGLSALAIPVVGDIVGLGILWATLTGAGVGIVSGGLVGALVGQGIPEAHAREYEEHVRRGAMLLTVHTVGDEQSKQASEILGRFGALDVRKYLAEI